jgi:hypothetical protein
MNASQVVFEPGFIAAFDRHVQRYGYAAVTEALHLHHLQLGHSPGGRPEIVDSTRLARMRWHLENDADLIERRDHRPHSEAARRAICDLPRDGDIARDGKILEKAYDRLVEKFMLEYGFALDIEGRGFDEGYLTNRRPRPKRSRRTNS